MADPVVTTPVVEAPKPGTPEYNAAMVAKYDAANGITTEVAVVPGATQETTPVVVDPNAPKVPEGGSEKFFNKETGVYNWAAHVAELNFKLAQKGLKPGETPPVDPNAPVVDPLAAEKPAAEIVPPVVSDEDWQSFKTEVQSTGKFSETTREKLTKLGIPKEFVDSHEAMVAQVRDNNVKVAHDYAGGPDKMNELLTWAGKSLTAAEVGEYNTMLASQNWRVAIDSLKARHSATARTAGEPGLVVPGGGSSDGAPAAFANQGEMVTAMSKRNDKGQKMYEVDPAYRDSVRQRIALSNF